VDSGPATLLVLEKFALPVVLWVLHSKIAAGQFVSNLLQLMTGTPLRQNQYILIDEHLEVEHLD